MLVVHWWYDSEFARWNGSVNTAPEVNATGRSLQQMKDYIEESWNRQFPDDPKTVDDFEFIEVSPPA
jgi:hypothetical protein